MEKELFDDLILSLNQAVEYSKGDKTKGRSMTITIPDEELEMNQMISHQVRKLSSENKRKVMQYAEELLQVSNG